MRQFPTRRRAFEKSHKPRHSFTQREIWSPIGVDLHKTIKIALAHHGVGVTVRMPEGVFYFSEPVNVTGVLLRGAGPNKTVIRLTENFTGNSVFVAKGSGYLNKVGVYCDGKSNFFEYVRIDL